MTDFSLLSERKPANLIDRIEMLALRKFMQKPFNIKLDAPIISFSFDDAPKSALNLGAQMLEAENIKATYYLCGNNDGKVFEGVEQFDNKDVKRLYENGHEIACHTFGHSRLRRRTIDEIENDFDENLKYFKKLLGDDFDFQSHAFPYGEFDNLSRAVCSGRFTTTRGVTRGVNYGKTDFANLLTVPLEQRRFSQEYLDGFINEAIQNNGWLIFYSHEVEDNPTPYGSTPQILEAAIKATKANNIKTMRVDEAALMVLQN